MIHNRDKNQPCKLYPLIMVQFSTLSALHRQNGPESICTAKRSNCYSSAMASN